MPETLFWEITERCNLRCIHCYNAELIGGRKPGVGPELCTDEAKRVIDRLVSGGVSAVHFLGGEPFVREDFMEICEYAKSRGCSISITTNGTILQDRWLDLVGSIDLRGLYISLDGTTAEVNDRIRGNGTFDRIVANAARIRRAVDRYGARTDLRLAYTITAANLESILGLPELLRGCGFHGATVGMVSRNGGAFGHPELTVVDQRIVCETLERLFQRLEDFPEVNLRMKGFKPLVLKYFSLKYPRQGTKITRQTLRCMAFEQTIVLRADGMAFLCGPMGFLLDGKSEQVIPSVLEYIPASGEPFFGLDLREGRNNRTFKPFLEFIESGEAYNCSDSCRTCEFYRRCQVCPLYDLSEDGRMVACDWAADALDAYKRSVVERIPTASPRVTIVVDGDVPYLVGGNLASRIRLNETGVALWEKFDGEKRLAAIVDEIEDTYSAGEGDPEIAEQIIAFCNRLVSYGALRLN